MLIIRNASDELHESATDSRSGFGKLIYSPVGYGHHVSLMAQSTKRADETDNLHTNRMAGH